MQTHTQRSAPPACQSDAKTLVKVVPSQWQSTRRVAGVTACPGSFPWTDRSARDVAGVEVALRDAADMAVVGTEHAKPPAVPPLDFSKLAVVATVDASANTAAGLAQTKKANAHQQLEEGEGERTASRKSFELTFLRKARFAKTLKRK